MPQTPQLALFPDSLFPHPQEKGVSPAVPRTHTDATPWPKPAVLPAGTQWHTQVLQGHPIGYMLRRSKRKSVGLNINDSGLLITAPAWVPLGHIQAVLEKKASWILSKLKQVQERQAQLAVQHLQWQDGEQIPYLGCPITLRINPVLPEPQFSGAPFAPQAGNTLYLPLRRAADSEQLRDSTQSWLQQQARHYFQQRLQVFLDKGGLRMNRLRLSAPAKRWGSCNSDGTIMLNWRLIHFPPSIIDYVVAHEVAHLKEMNHSRAFWDYVEFLLPEFHQARAQLRQHDPGTLPLL